MERGPIPADEEVVLRDALDRPVAIKISTLSDYFIAGKAVIAGMSVETILALRGEYLRRGGPYAITPETVRQTFGER